MHFNPARITSHLLESIMMGTRDTSGSEATKFRKFTISLFASNRPSSMLTSITMAPSATCLRAMASASSYCLFSMRRRNLRLPATLHRSPTFTKRMSGVSSNSSKPLNHITSGFAFGWWGILFLANWANLAINSSVVPQHPPTMFTKPSSKYSSICCAMLSADSSYCPNELGRPALG